MTSEEKQHEADIEKYVKKEIKTAQEKRDEQLADKWITELEAAGLTPDQMLRVFKMAREKYKLLIAKNKK